MNNEISNERLEELAKGDMEIWYSESKAMAKELLALRNAREGWKLVPVEPTKEMLEEIWLDERFKEVAMKRRYQALLAAAPEPPC
ncbi:hypothetical protein [uncultured Pantoea sp.]|uniref:hypothetical protein n=1 Tax=uncultured Pantoea sp. TaxID=218084 RepID=UPI00258FAD43|nr:hypothetical protein [uncultured Pantoea sp.]